MMKKKLTGIISVAFCCGVSAVLTTILTAGAGPWYHTDFIGEDGSQPENWTYLADPYEETSIQNNTLHSIRPESGAGRTALVFTGTDNHGGNPYEWSDYTVTSRLQGSHFHVAGSFGIMARYNNDNDGYWAYVAANDSIAIAKNNGVGQFNSPIELEKAELDLMFDALFADTWYWLEFTVEGDNLTATLFEDDNGAMGNQLGSVSAVDSDFATGTAGIRCNFTGTGSRSVSYDSLTVIPEPTSLLLLGLGGLMLLHRRRD